MDITLRQTLNARSQRCPSKRELTVYQYLFFQNYENVSAEVWKINPSEDVVKAANTRGEPRGPAQQILYDCYVSSFCFIASRPLSKIFQPQVMYCCFG